MKRRKRAATPIWVKATWRRRWRGVCCALVVVTAGDDINQVGFDRIYQAMLTVDTA